MAVPRSIARRLLYLGASAHRSSLSLFAKCVSYAPMLSPMSPYSNRCTPSLLLLQLAPMESALRVQRSLSYRIVSCWAMTVMKASSWSIQRVQHV